MIYAFRKLIVGLSVGGALSAAPAKVQRDWRQFPAVAQTDANEDIYVVGDVHGDYQRLVRALAAASVIKPGPPDPKHVEWRAGHAIVVFMGDLIDKGHHALDAIDCVQALRNSAKAAGGQVFSVVGNHEAEFLADPSAAKVADFAGELKARGLAPADTAACRNDVGQFLCSEPFAVRVRGWFFSHGGDTHGRTMSKLSGDLQAGVDADGFATKELIGGDSLLEARLGEKGPDGGPWLESDPTHNAQMLLQRYVDALGVKHLVQGHQPGGVTFADGTHRKKGQMFQRYGLIFLVDTGMSEGVDDSDGAVLLIKAPPAEEAIAICPDGLKTSIWNAKTSPALGSAKTCGR